MFDPDTVIYFSRFYIENFSPIFFLHTKFIKNQTQFDIDLETASERQCMMSKLIRPLFPFSM